MLKEQLFGLAMKALSAAYKTKERIKGNLNTDNVREVIERAKERALDLLLKQGQLKDSSSFGLNFDEGDASALGVGARQTVESAAKKMVAMPTVKKQRKSSIKPVSEIPSSRADMILALLKADSSRKVKNNDSLEGKKSLAYLVWALGHAERAQLSDGISIHDVSSLLYRACNIELYPINISRVVHSNPSLVRQVNQNNRTKTYLLTEKGAVVFKEKFL